MESAEGLIEFGRYFYVLRRRWYVVVAMSLIGGLAAGGFLLLTPTTATASAVVDVNVVSSEPFDLARPEPDLLNRTTEVQLARSPDVIGPVADALDLQVADVRDRMTATVLPDATVMRLEYRATSAEDAVAGADALARSYLERRAAATDARVATMVDRLNQRRESLQADLAEATAKVNGARGTALAEAQANQAAVRTELELLLGQVNELAGIDTSGGRVLVRAEDNSVAITPARTPVLVTGILGGLALGLVAAFVINATDRRVRGRLDIKDAGGHEVLAELRAPSADVPANSEDMEALRSMREHLLATLPPEGAVLAVTHIGQDTTASDVAINIAVTMTEAGVPTDLILAEFPSTVLEHLDQPLGLRRRGDAARDVARMECVEYPGLVIDVPTSGAGSSRVAATYIGDLLRSDGQLDRRQLSIVALPPQVARSLVLTTGRLGHSVLLVASRGTTRKQELDDIAGELVSVGAEILGTVLQKRSRAWGPAQSRRSPDSDEV